MSARPSPQVIERQLSFTSEDMELFAAASGDRSPLHTDPAFARRTSFGECIVHGGLLSIGMLGLLPPDVLANVTSVRSQFPGPVLPGATSIARARSHPNRPDEWEVRLTGRGKALARLATSTRDREPAALDEAALLQRARASADGGPQVIIGEYRVGPELQALAGRFGVEGLDPRVLEGIAWTSHVVGVTIPDFDGLCAAVTVLAASSSATGSAPARQWVRLRDYDERTGRLLIEGVLSDDAGAPRCTALIECFPFSPTPSDAAVLTSAGPLEPGQGTVVVVGASRGAGAALSLALLARGCFVHGIYSSSSEGAAELTRLAGPYAARLSLHRIDAGDPASVTAITTAVGSSIAGLALCAAPPPLPMGVTAESAGELANYVARSISLAAVPLGSFLPLLQRESGWVLFCSASALLDPSRDLPQFGAAKGALEGLARWVAATTPRARIVIARLPKLRTDLVNTPAGRLAAVSPKAVMASIVEQLGAEDHLAPGLSIIELDPAEVSA